MILTDEQTQIRDMARQFAQDRLAPTAEARDRSHAFPRDEMREMGALGFLGMLMPEEYGGADVGVVSYALALEEIAAADGACSTIMSVHNSVGYLPILKYGSDDQKNRFLPDMASGAKIGGFALTEPQAGSDASMLKTTALRDGDHYVLNGAKQFITSGKNGDVIIVMAVTDKAAGKKGISSFIVPTDTPGYEVVRVEDKLGQNCSDTCQLSFTDMRVPAANRLGEEGEGYKIALANLEGGPDRHCRAIGGHGARRVRGRPGLCRGTGGFWQTDFRASGGAVPAGRHGHADRCCPSHGFARRRPARSGPALSERGLYGQAFCL